MLLVTTDPYEYRYISQGDVAVAGLNDAEEYIATDVRIFFFISVLESDFFVQKCELHLSHLKRNSEQFYTLIFQRIIKILSESKRLLQLVKRFKVIFTHLSATVLLYPQILDTLRRICFLDFDLKISPYFTDWKF